MTVKLLAIVGIIFGYIGFFYFYCIDLRAVFITLLYFIGALAFPGYLITNWYLERFALNEDFRTSWPQLIALSTIFGIGNILLSYFVLHWFSFEFLKYIWALPYIIFCKYVYVIFKKFQFRNISETVRQIDFNLLITFLIFTLFLNYFILILRPTPGIVPLYIFHDHLWNAGNTVSLIDGFPLQSMNIESMPNLAYHILIHILGAHLSLVTGLKAHLSGLQYVFIPLVPLLILNIIALLYSFGITKNSYIFYGLMVLLFGGGFVSVHEVKVASLLRSSTNFLGVLFLFAYITIWLKAKEIKLVGKFFIIFFGVFLATASKGSIGVALSLGTFIWIVFIIWRKTVNRDNIIEFCASSLGFLSSYTIFFILPVYNQEAFVENISSLHMIIFPFSYVTKNSLAGPIAGLIEKYFSGSLWFLFYTTLILIMLPIHFLLYYTYRIFAIIKTNWTSLNQSEIKIFAVVAGSLVIGYMVNKNPQDHAYFLSVALYLLDVLFITVLFTEKVFSKIKEYYLEKNSFSLIGVLFIVVLPFINLNGWFNHSYIFNIAMYGKIGQKLEPIYKDTEYRRFKQVITPELYECLDGIRKNTDNNIIVVTPFISIADGRNLAFFTSTFSERTAFIEGYEFGNVRSYTGKAEIERRLNIIKDIYEKKYIPMEMHEPKYVFILRNNDIMEYEKKYAFHKIFKNNEWIVINNIKKKGSKEDIVGN